MDRSELFEVVEKMRKHGMDSGDILDALMRSLSSDTLEEHLRYIDRNYETHAFND